MNCFVRPQAVAVIVSALAHTLAAAAVPGLVLESNQTPLDGSLRTGGSTIAGGDIKTLPFTSGTSRLELSAVDMGLIGASNTNFQIDFLLYSTLGSGEPLTLLYTTSFTASLTTSSAWYSMPISYVLSPSTTYAFGFRSPVSGAVTQVKWANTANSTWPPLSSGGYSGFGTDGYVEGTSNPGGGWGTTGTANAFRLYAVPESPAGSMLPLSLVALGLYGLRRGRNSGRSCTASACQRIR